MSGCQAARISERTSIQDCDCRGLRSGGIDSVIGLLIKPSPRLRACLSVCLAFLCCDRDVSVSDDCAAAVNDCLSSSMLLLIVAKNNPAPQDKEDRMGGDVVFFLSSPSLADYPPSLSQSNLCSPSFIIYPPPLSPASRFPSPVLWPQ